MTELSSSTDSPEDTPAETPREPRRKIDRLSLAAITVVSLAVAIFITLGIVEIFGTERDDAVDVSEVLEDSTGVGEQDSTGVGEQDSTGVGEQDSTGVGEQGSGALEVGSSIPQVDLELLGGGSTSTAELLGGPLVINFWSSTCAPCLAEMPEFESVYRELDGTVAFLGVDVTDSAEAGEKMVERTGISYPNARDPRGEVIRAFGGTALPRTVLVDSDGRVAALHDGALDAQQLKDSLHETGLS